MSHFLDLSGYFLQTQINHFFGKNTTQVKVCVPYCTGFQIVHTSFDPYIKLVTGRFYFYIIVMQPLVTLVTAKSCLSALPTKT